MIGLHELTDPDEADRYRSRHTTTKPSRRPQSDRRSSTEDEDKDAGGA